MTDKEKLNNPLKGWQILSFISLMVFHRLQCATLITDPPPNSSTTFSKQFFCYHMTCEMWWGVNMLSKFQLPSSYGLAVMMS